MLCVSVSPKSRKLAKVDIINGAVHGDIVELCLDRLVREPDVSEMLDGIDAKVIVSCRTPPEGGEYRGSDQERMTLFRSAVIAEPEYVELPLELAHQIPRFGKTKRIVSMILERGERLDRDELIGEAKRANADVIKLVAPANTLEESWPLLKVVASKPEIPIVAFPLGDAATMLTLFMRKLGAPWVYAALEPAMRQFPQQPVAFDLNELFSLRTLTPATRLLGLLGTPDEMELPLTILNRAFAELDASLIACPIVSKGSEALPKMLDKLKVPALYLCSSANHLGVEYGTSAEENVKQTGMADVLLNQKGTWNGFNLLWRGFLQALESEMGRTGDGPSPLGSKTVLVLGAGPVAKSACYALSRRETILNVAAHDEKAAQQLAERFDSRHVPFATLYNTLFDVVVYTDAKMTPGYKRGEMNPSLLRDGMVFVDLSRLSAESPMAIEARERGCKIVPSKVLFARIFSALIKSLTGKTVPVETLTA